MKYISLDIETFSDIDLQKCGVYRYASSPNFEILLFGYSVDGGEVQVVDLALGESIPEDIMTALKDEKVIKWAFNATFERICLSRYLGAWLEPEGWHCTMVWAATLGLPLSLEGVGAVLGLEKQKLTEGKNLIKYFCCPCLPTKANGERTRNIPKHDMDKWQQFKAYNLRDVETEMGIQAKLSRFPVPESIWEEYQLDQEINDRGIGVAEEFVENAIKLDAQVKSELKTKMQKLTDLENPNSVQQMVGWLADNGLETDSLGKKQVAELLKTAPKNLGEVLRLRQKLAKSSVKKYTTMKNALCQDGRVHGMFQFYGANRTGRFSGRLVQLQNLPQNHISDLAAARGLVAAENFDALALLYEDVPDTLSQLIRTAFVPQEGRKFIVADFSAIEARVIAWLAGESWKSAAFAEGQDIYCSTASKMFGVPVKKHGANADLRQKGKIAELACIAEGELVLTDCGLVPIEKITSKHRLWDGENWVNHKGVIYKGEREVIEYEGLRATPDHLVWVEGESGPVEFIKAATSGSHLIQTGNGRKAIRLGEHNFSREKMERKAEPLLCTDKMYGLRECPVAGFRKFTKWKIKRLPDVFSTKANSCMAGKKTYSSKTTMRKSQGQRLSQLWSKGYLLQFFERNCCRVVHDKRIWFARQENGNRQNRYKRSLSNRKLKICFTLGKLYKSKKIGFKYIRPAILAICEKCCDKKVIARIKSRRDNFGSRISCFYETKKLENNQCKTRLYDIRNAGEHHRFTVSGKLVHNCGYGGSIGALKAMGALDMGLKEEELKPLVDSWRAANPKIVRLWWDVDRAAKDTIKMRITTETHGIRFSYAGGFLFITLPSGRKLAYVKPRIGENKFGGESITYEGVGTTKKWERLESYGPKLCENITQAIARDLLVYAMLALRHCAIVAHVHDEIIIEADKRMSLGAVCEQMGRTPPWAKGLILRADGYECGFYKKD